ncbi:excinuclease ABC subunit C [Corynebacterium sp. HMSC073H12]|uniref:excinuclease ABC subunit UvrC n=1 Tax=Corynebacterium sp. HMSC073H12 TaxID=1715187 RepID=UPI0008A96343|nr:excinuclease ABC subunit UvrC [Corynebacterium sp. HMSC073H12]OHQ77424.1 excinuclease ABC subunit C [Corynebacterium sp. HMSC073H12]
MTDPSQYRPAPGTIPTEPGVYRFLDSTGRVLYVGKAKNLRARLSNYFQDLTRLHPRTRQMVQSASKVTWTVVHNEVEALQLEYTWIKRFNPRFNVMYRDDKSYPMLAVSVGELYPRLFLYRGPRRKGVRYFGPYSHAWAIRETLDLLTRVFPARTCSKGVFNRQQALGRPCLLGYIDKCSAPCVGRVSAEEHREIVRGFTSFMSGNTSPVTRRLKKEMEEAAGELDFERAASLRDNLAAIDKVMERQSVVLSDAADADFIALATDELEAAVQIFHVRAGRIYGQRGWVVEKSGEYATTEFREGETDPSLGGLLTQFLTQFYGDAAKHADVDGDESTTAAQVVPREILVQATPDDLDEVAAFLADIRGTNVDIRVPQRGDKRTLMETVQKNAAEALRQHKLKRSGDLTTRSQALSELQDALFMDEAPLRIECTDISHIQGTDVVASLVVFEDGLPKKSDYRRYRIKDAAGDGRSDDVGSIAEVVRRRFLRHNEDKLAMPDDASEMFVEETTDAVDEQSRSSRKFAYPPQLFIVDGGAPQVAAAQAVLDELEVTDVTLVGIAKRLEELWIPDDDEPLILPRNSEAMYLIQRIRDEAHRFAITYHRQQRSKRMRSSVLDGIKGLGPARRSELVKHFGSVAALKKASVEQIEEVAGFGPMLAKTVYDYLHPDEKSSEPKSDVGTGE